jgi:sulfite reductase (NADPH) flavoprotein alpha-component
VQSGTLTRLALAFSRDRAEAGPKEYVQQRMWENSAELFGWLQDGAHAYVNELIKNHRYVRDVY